MGRRAEGGVLTGTPARIRAVTVAAGRRGLVWLRWLRGFAGAIAGRVMRHNVTGRSSQFSYNAFVATIPFLFVLVSIIGLVASADTYDRLIDEYGDVIPTGLDEVLRLSLQQATSNTQQATFFLVLGIVSALYLTGNVLGTLASGFDDAFEVPGRPWLRGKALSILFAAAAGLLVTASTLALAGGPQMLDAALRLLGAGDDARAIVRQSVFWIGLGSLFAFVLLLYRFLPNVSGLTVRDVLPGTVFAVGGWLAATRLFRLYVDGFANYNAVYGALWTIVVYLIFLYLTGLFLVIGCEVSAEARMRRRGAAVSDPGRATSAEAPT